LTAEQLEIVQSALKNGCSAKEPDSFAPDGRNGTDLPAGFVRKKEVRN